MLTGHGGLDKLEYREDVPIPSPEEDEVLIEVSACGMNNTDINTRTGWYSKSVTSATGESVARSEEDGSWGGALTFPLIQGADPIGRIVAVGNRTNRVRIGERVLVDAWIRSPAGALEDAAYLGSERNGGYADYVTVPAINAHKVESDLSDVELASFPCSYATAEHMLHRAGVSSGQWVLVTGASGGVGGALIQLSKRRNANVVAVTTSSKMDRMRDFGADITLDRSMDDLDQAVLEATGGVDVFADVVGGDGFARLFEIIRRGGHYTTSGAIGGPIVSLDLRTLYLHDITMHGATVLPSEVFENLVGYIERSEVRPVVAAVFSLEEMADAQTAFTKKGHVGAIVIDLTETGQ